MEAETLILGDFIFSKDLNLVDLILEEVLYKRFGELEKPDENILLAYFKSSWPLFISFTLCDPDPFRSLAT